MSLDQFGGGALVAGLPPGNERQIAPLIPAACSARPIPGPAQRRVTHSVKQVDAIGMEPLRLARRALREAGTPPRPIWAVAASI
jgi:hypothetical protein